MQIYKITNCINHKNYVGKDKHDSENYYGSGLLIKQAIKKYGKINFSKEIIENCSSMQEMALREIFWIKEFNCLTPNGYNISKGGDGGDNTSHHPNKIEIIEKRRIKNVGQKRSVEICEKMSKIQREFQQNLSVEEKKKRGIAVAKSRNERIKKSGYTDKEIEAHKQIKEKLIKYNQSKEGRERVSNQFKGKKKKPFSLEHRKNIGKASKGRYIPGKKIIIENIVYDSLHDAQRKLKIPLMTIKNRLLNKNFKNWNYFVCE